MSLIKKIKNLKAKIESKSSEMLKEQILAYNKECFKAHFDDGEGEIFVYPQECVKSAEDGKQHGYVYRGVYQGADLLGVKVYESENVELNEFKDIKALKNKSGKDLFSLDELVEFDYNHTRKIWKKEIFQTSPNKNKMKATKEVMNELINRRFNDLKKTL